MAIRVDLNPILRRNFRPDYDPEKGLILADGAGKTLYQIVNELGIPFDEISSTLVNNRFEEPSYKVQEGDSICLTVAISGG